MNNLFNMSDFKQEPTLLLVPPNKRDNLFGLVGDLVVIDYVFLSTFPITVAALLVLLFASVLKARKIPVEIR